MPNLDGVKTPSSHKKKINANHHIDSNRKKMAHDNVSKTVSEGDAKPIKTEIKREINIEPKNENPKNDGVSHLSVEERKRMVWAGAIIVMVVVVGVWIWLLPSSLRVTATRTDNKDWNEFRDKMNKTLMDLQANSADKTQQLQNAKNNIIPPLNNSNSNKNADEETNINEAPSEEINNSNQNNINENSLPVINNTNNNSNINQ